MRIADSVHLYVLLFMLCCIAVNLFLLSSETQTSSWSGDKSTILREVKNDGRIQWRADMENDTKGAKGAKDI